MPPPNTTHLASVNFYAECTLLGSVSNAPYTLTATGLAAGSYALTAVAVDGSGLTSTSAPVNITVTSRQRPALRFDDNGPVAAFLNMPTTFTGTLPTLLSHTGVFSNTTSRTPAAGLIPYAPNVPQWSDGAVKSCYHGGAEQRRRHHAGRTDSISADESWTFPAGTVFVKNFDLVVNETNASGAFAPVGNGAAGARQQRRGLWRDLQMAAGQQRRGPADRQFVGKLLITNATGVRTQTWYYPSPSDCLECHNTAVANNPSGINVLGVNARQLNGSLTYPATGVTDNQLRTLNRLGLFYPAINEAAISGYSAALGDDESERLSAKPGPFVPGRKLRAMPPARRPGSHLGCAL